MHLSVPPRRNSRSSATFQAPPPHTKGRVVATFLVDAESEDALCGESARASTADAQTTFKAKILSFSSPKSAATVLISRPTAANSAAEPMPAELSMATATATAMLSVPTISTLVEVDLPDPSTTDPSAIEPAAEADPVEAGPATAGPMEASPSTAGHIKTGPAQQDPMEAGPASAGPMEVDPAPADPMEAAPATAGPMEAVLTAVEPLLAAESAHIASGGGVQGAEHLGKTTLSASESFGPIEVEEPDDDSSGAGPSTTDPFVTSPDPDSDLMEANLTATVALPPIPILEQAASESPDPPAKSQANSAGTAPDVASYASHAGHRLVKLCVAVQPTRPTHQSTQSTTTQASQHQQAPGLAEEVRTSLAQFKSEVRDSLDRFGAQLQALSEALRQPPGSEGGLTAEQQLRSQRSREAALAKRSGAVPPAGPLDRGRGWAAISQEGGVGALTPHQKIRAAQQHQLALARRSKAGLVQPLTHTERPQPHGCVHGNECARPSAPTGENLLGFLMDFAQSESLLGAEGGGQPAGLRRSLDVSIQSRACSTPFKTPRTA